MPGPKMGPRPPDFNEASLKQSPTYIKWSALQDGEKLRYACREFIKGHEQDEERLLRRIMIARRNNIRDHETLKVARRVGVGLLNTVPGPVIPRSTSEKKVPKEVTAAPTETSTEALEPANVNDLMDVDDTIITNTRTVGEAAPPGTTVLLPTTTTTTTTRSRRPPQTFSDHQIEQEMDVAAVIKTRSYRSWLEVPDGGEFVVRYVFYLHTPEVMYFSSCYDTISTSSLYALDRILSLFNESLFLQFILLDDTIVNHDCPFKKKTVQSKIY
jgi:hypothetical protein